MRSWWCWAVLAVACAAASDEVPEVSFYVDQAIQPLVHLLNTEKLHKLLNNLKLPDIEEKGITLRGISLRSLHNWDYRETEERRALVSGSSFDDLYVSFSLKVDVELNVESLDSPARSFPLSLLADDVVLHVELRLVNLFSGNSSVQVLRFEPTHFKGFVFTQNSLLLALDNKESIYYPAVTWRFLRYLSQNLLNVELAQPLISKLIKKMMK